MTTERYLVPATLKCDAYGSIWIGEPGDDGSTAIGWLAFEEDGESAQIEFYPPEEWMPVVHRNDGTTLGGQLVTEEEQQDGRLMLVRYGHVPSWLEESIRSLVYGPRDGSQMGITDAVRHLKGALG